MKREILFDILDEVPLSFVLIHQLLGCTERFIKLATEFAERHRTIFCIHDFYPICPRATLVDAQGDVCQVAAPDVCDRCVTVGGAHPNSRITIPVAEQRKIFGSLLRASQQIIAPSRSAARYLRIGIPDVDITVIPHPETPSPAMHYPAENHNEVILLGAIGPHKGSVKLLALATRARLHAPDLHFTVIGYTDIDAELCRIGNVSITGAYKPDQLPELIRAAGGSVALFLQCCPETYSYTLTEAIRAGLFPVVADIGAPPERVREYGFGVIYPYPIDTRQVLDLLRNITADNAAAVWQHHWPMLIQESSTKATEKLRQVLFDIKGSVNGRQSPVQKRRGEVGRGSLPVLAGACMQPVGR